MSYADSADLTKRYDSRTLADLASDTGTPEGDLSTSDRVSTALEDASGRIDAAVMQGRMYEADDLAGLTGNSLALLKRIACELAVAYLMSCRPERFGAEEIAAAGKAAEDYLERLRKGERLFVVEKVQDAQLPTIDGPTAVDYNRLNMIPERCHGYYPRRSTRLPIGRG